MHIKIIQSLSTILHVEFYTYKKWLISLWQYMFNVCILYVYCRSLNENNPLRGTYIWTPHALLMKLLGKDYEVWPLWRKYVIGAGL